MKLTVLERLRMGEFIPQQSDALTMTIARDIVEKVTISQEEQKLINLRIEPNPNNPNELLQKWDDENAKDKEIDFTDAEIKVLREKVQEKNTAKTITMADLTIVEKIQSEKLSSEA